MDGQLREIASWHIISEIVCRYPGRFRIIETHPGGGQYDCLSIFDTRVAHIADLNRRGSLHILRQVGAADRGRRGAEPLDVWEQMARTGDIRRIVDKACRRMGLEVPDELPPIPPDGLVYRFVAHLLSHAAFGQMQWECRNGCFDTSGYGGGVSHAFEAFPSAQARLQKATSEDLFNEAAYRFWFVFRGHEPVLALETTGWVWNANDDSFDLMRLYEVEGRIWPLILKIAFHLLP